MQFVQFTRGKGLVEDHAQKPAARPLNRGEAFDCADPQPQLSSAGGASASRNFAPVADKSIIAARRPIPVPMTEAASRIGPLEPLRRPPPIFFPNAIQQRLSSTGSD